MVEDSAGRAMGDAGKGSFEDSQNKAETDTAAKADGAAGAAESADWHAKLRDQLGGKDGPNQERTHAAGPGRGRS
jgi:hypothetical protein